MYRAGIIGTGGVAGMGIFGTDPTESIGTEPVDRSHAGGYRAASDIELVAIADIDSDALNRFGEAWNIPAEDRYLSHEAMLAEAELDIVSICSPSMYHRQHVIDAANTEGMQAMWCEKPLSCSVADAEAATTACASADVHLVVNHSTRFLRQSGALRRALADDLIGDIQSVSAGTSMELFRVGTHTVDLVRYLINQRATAVGGIVTEVNEAAAHLGDDVRLDDAGGGGFIQFEGDIFATFDGTVDRDTAATFIRIVGSDGRLILDEHGWTHWVGGGRSGDPLEARDPPTDEFEDDHRQSFVNAANHLVDLIDGDVTNISPGDDAVLTTEILIGFFISHATGATIDFPLDEPLKDVTVTSW